MFEVLPCRILFDRGIKSFIRCENDSFLFFMKFLIKILNYKCKNIVIKFVIRRDLFNKA